jgi:hypothetical protein
MAQTNFTPISLYYSTTASAVPVNTNLANGELAINITDGKLFYKDNSGVVQTIASKSTSTIVAVANGGTGLNSIPATSIPVANIANTYTTIAPGAGQSVRVNTTGTAWEVFTPGTSSGSIVGVSGTAPIVSSGSTSIAISLDAAYGDTLNPYASKAANYVLAAPNGTAGVPTFRALVSADIPALNYQAPITLTTTGTSGAATLVGSTLNIPEYSGGGGGSGTVTKVSVVSANGLAGTVANDSTTPAITISTTITGLLKGNGTAISAASSGTDYAPATSGTSILYGNNAGGFSNVTVGSGLSFTTGTLSATGGGGVSQAKATMIDFIFGI